MRFFVWADRDSNKLDIIKESADLCGVNLELAGVGQTVNLKEWGHFFKLSALCDALTEIDDNEIVCATDGYDVFYQQGQQAIEEAFLSMGCDVVFSAEKWYSHQYRRYKAFYDAAEGESPYRYLNAGSVVGYAGALRKLYKTHFLWRMWYELLHFPPVYWLAKKTSKIFGKIFHANGVINQEGIRYTPWHDCTDQTVMGKLFATKAHGLDIALDRECRIFWCTAGEWDNLEKHFEIIGQNIVNKHTGNTPACIHVPWEQKYRSILVDLWNTLKDVREKNM